MNYQISLNSAEWKKKAKAIRERDKNRCQRCGLKWGNGLFHTSLGRINLHEGDELLYFEEGSSKLNTVTILKKKYGIRFSGRTHLKENELLSEDQELQLSAHTVNRTHVNYNVKVSLLNLKPRLDFSIVNEEFFRFMKDKSGNDWEIQEIDVDRHSGWVTTENEKFLYQKKTLQVHHLCYRRGIDIWEHPDEEYITLCNICHLIVHQENTIPVYSSTNELLVLVESCERCGGSGHMPQFNHVQGGVCFACNGVGGRFEKEGDDVRKWI